MPKKDHFERFEDHTLLKHLILQNYLGAWANKLLRWGRAGDRVWFVDAFAGAGGDQQGKPGSPVIAASIAADVNQTLAAEGQSGSVRVLAIERDRKHFESLQQAMASYTAQPQPILRHGTLAERVDGFVRHVGQQPVLYFLDPFGVEGLLADLLPKLLRGPHNEIFALFSDTGAVRLHAALLARPRDPDQEEADVLNAPMLFPGYTAELAAGVRAEAERSAAALHFTQEAGQSILSQALGAGRWAHLSSLPLHARPAAFTSIFVELLRDAGARYVMALPVRNSENDRMYQLVHASKSAQGFRTMKEAMASALNRSRLPEHVRESITLDLNVEIDAVVSQVVQHFEGKTVLWTDSKNKHTRTVRNYCLEETPAFRSHLADVKQRLSDVWTASKKPLTFRF